jgi:CheY-like chemotaxis protein
MKQHILIADDDEDDRLLLKEAFEAAGSRLDLAFAQNGHEVFDSLKSNKECPKVIMLDLNMPRKDGMQVLKELKSNPNYSSIPVIIFSTSEVKEQIKKCYQLGASTFIIKPGSFQALVTIVQMIIAYWINTAVLPN